MARTYQLTEVEAQMAFEQVSSHCQALKNWLVSAVERHDFEDAMVLATKLRQHEKLYAKLNVEAHKIIDAHMAK